MLQFIRRARDFGLPMVQVKRLVELWRDDKRASRDVKRVALQHVAELRAKIAELTAMADALQDLADRCHGNSRPECPILKDLGAANTGSMATAPRPPRSTAVQRAGRPHEGTGQAGG